MTFEEAEVRIAAAGMSLAGQYTTKDKHPPGLLPDWMIYRDKIVVGAAEGIKRPGKISFGYSSMGVDIRVGYKFRVFTPTRCQVIDPKDFSSAVFDEIDLTPIHQWNQGVYEQGSGPPTQHCLHCGNLRPWSNADEILGCKGKPDHILIPPNSFALAESVESFDVPDDVLGICIGKSTYARCSLIVNVTPLEAGWRGKLTIELSNTAPLPLKVYAAEGIAQVLFFRGAAKPCRTYATKGGKYQHDHGLQAPKVD